MTSTTDLAVRQPSAALAIRPNQDMFDPKQKAALEVLGIKGASNADMAVFMHVCQRTGLDPFSRQIYYIFRGGRWVIQTGIGGYQVIRDRVAERLGIDVEYEDTVWYDSYGQPADVWLNPEPPSACKVVVRKGGKRFPAIVLWREVAALKDGRPQSEWAHQPAHMLEKCAEAAALRRAFPQDLSGLYTEDEMPPETVQVRSERVTAADILQTPAGQEQETPDPAATPAQPVSSAFHGGPAATQAQVGKIQGEFKRLGFTDDEREQRLAAIAALAGLPGLDSSSSLRKSEAHTVIERLTLMLDRDALITYMATGELPLEGDRDV